LQALQEIVSIFGVPRSGTSWLGQIFNSSPYVAYRFQPLFSYTFKGRLNEESAKEEINSFYDDIYNTDDEFVLQYKNISGNKNIIFPKKQFSHLITKEVHFLNIIENLLKQTDRLKIIGIIRNPFSVISSWIKTPKEFSPT
jgi:hypothetical protein